MSRILIVDDEASIGWAFRDFLSADGHTVDLAASAEEAIEIAARQRPDVVVLDVRLPRLDGLSAMRLLREQVGRAPIVVITAFGNLETAVRAIEGGAFDYLVKPFDLARAADVVRRALDAAAGDRQTRSDGQTLDASDAIVGSAPAMQEVFKRIALVAATDVPVLITGESGTGKELVARAVHRHSHRRNGPFLPVSLPALSPSLVESELFGHVRGAFTGASQDRKGLLELANGGTLFLDEIADTPPALQVKLLRAVESREFTPVGGTQHRDTNIRVLAATNRPLAEFIHAGQFREDLYFRLSVFQIHVPPLRERRDDLSTLAAHFVRMVAMAGKPPAISDDCHAELLRRSWPGNVRELRNAMEHAVIVARSGPIRAVDLPPADDAPAARTISLEQDLAAKIADWTSRRMLAETDESFAPGLYERLLELVEPPFLKAALDRCGQNRAATAQSLGLNRATLRDKLRRYGIG